MNHRLHLFASAIAVALSIVFTSSCQEQIEPEPEAVDSQAPTISFKQSVVNVFGGLEFKVADGAMYIGETIIADWADDRTKPGECIVSATLDGKSISPGTILEKEGTLEFTVADGSGNMSDMKTVNLTVKALFGIETLKSKSYFIDQEYDLAAWLSTVNGFVISKVEILQDGKRSEAMDPTRFRAEKWGELSLVFTLSRQGKDLEVLLEGVNIAPLTYKMAIAIADAANEYRYENSKGRGYTTKVTDKGMENLSVTGVHDLNSVLLESIQNGTLTMSARQVKELLFKNTIVILYEQPALKAFDEGELYKFDASFPQLISEDNHARTVMDQILAVARPVLKKLGKPVFNPTWYQSMSMVNFGEYATMHPELNFFSTASVLAGGYSVINSDGSLSWTDEYIAFEEFNDNLDHQLKWYYDLFQKALQHQNYYFSMFSFGNDTTDPRWRCEGSDGWWVQTLQECKDGKVGLYNSWTLGTDGVMSSDNGGTSHCRSYAKFDAGPYNAFSMYPTKAGWDSDRLWQETADLFDPDGQQEATSWACPTACAKAYLMTCANMLANPTISREENKKLIRSTMLDGTVLLDEKYLFTAKRMYPGGAISQFYSTLPQSVSVSSGTLVPIEHGLFLNSIVIGPGVVDAGGTEVTQENYHEMLGKKLFIDPSKLYKYGYKTGDAVEYTEHLCCDALGTGAMDNAAEAYKSISSKTFSISVL